ncbi:C-C chemokine receptor type 3 [Camelus dromedarius]|uniref:C-C chemokine receptor type 3 n=1 Tax=Camelus dromedarius TaxID=9838 RepID=A0A5N4CFR0_CAMDR|nr:C-C chemokine receptor type 3 [Camelus dromedarius]
MGEAVGTTPYDYEEAMPCGKGQRQGAGGPVPAFTVLPGVSVGLLGNAVVVMITTGIIHLLSVATLDLSYSHWIHYIEWNEWGFGHCLCKLLSGLYHMGLYSEIFFIILLTIDWYLAIVHTVFALQAPMVTFGIVTNAFTWGLAGLAALPEFIFHESLGRSAVLFTQRMGKMPGIVSNL